MKTSSLDILEKAELPPAQARAILKAMEIEMASGRDGLATRDDLWVVKDDLWVVKDELWKAIGSLEVKIAEVEGRLTRWVLTCILGQTVVLAGLGYFFLEHFKK